MRTFNVRLAAVLLAILVVFGVGVYLLHGYQLRRNAYMFKREAERSEKLAEEAAKSKDVNARRAALRASVSNLSWYVRFAPDDMDAMEHLGMMLADQAEDGPTSARAFGLLELVVRQDPQRKQARRRLVEMAMNLGRAQDAKEHLQQFLLKDNPEDPVLWELLGRCYSQTEEYGLAVENLKKALEIDPKQIEAYARLAALLRHRLGRDKEADQLMDKMVKNNPKSEVAHFLRGSYLVNTKAKDEAFKEAVKSLELKPDYRDGLWLAAQCCLDNGQFDRARDYATRSIKLYPDIIIMYTLLSDVELKAGNRAKAIAALEDGLKATARSPQLLWSLANKLIDIGKPKEAHKIIAELRTTEPHKELINYLIAREEFAQEHWKDSRQRFEAVRGGFLASPNMLKQIDLWIGQCYGHMGNRDMELVAYRRALKTDPFYTAARVGLMEAMLATGDTETAIKEFEHLGELGKVKITGTLPYARMLILHNLRQPVAKQDWKLVWRILDYAEQVSPDAVEIPIMRAEVLVAQNKLSEAEALLEQARSRTPDQVSLWIVLASLAERQKNWSKAERLLEEAQRTWGDTVAQRLALAQLLGQRHGKNAVDRLRKLADNVSQFSDAARLQLWRGLVNIAIQIGDTQFTQDLCRQIAEKQPNNVQIRFILFAQAMHAEDDAGMEQALKDLERVAGQGAYWLYGQAARLKFQAKQKKGAEQSQLLDRALDYLARAREVRPTWSRIPLMMAEICDLQGKVEPALKNYREAIEMGEYDPSAVQRAAQLLFQRQQYVEADRLLHRLDERKVPFSSDMNRVGAEAAEHLGEFNRALELARKSAPPESKRYQDHMWLGQMLTACAKRAEGEKQTQKAEKLWAEAEKALRRAVEVEPTIPATWVALIQLLRARDKEDQAEKLISQAGKSIPAKHAPLAIAQCYEVMGKSEAAEAKYEAALHAAPQDPLVLRTVADFYCRTSKTAPAENILRKFVEGSIQAQDADVMWARRQLALILSARGGYRNNQKARELIEKNLAMAETSVLDRRAKAGLDAMDPNPTRRDQAMHTLETLLEEQSATPDDLFQLAQMYRDAGAWGQASALFRKLVTSSGNEPLYLTTYIAALLEHGEMSDAEAYLGRLETAVPNHINTVGLRAEVLVAKNEPDKAIKLLNEFIDKKGARPPERNVRVRLVAEKFEQLARRLNKPNQKALADRFVRQAETLYRAHLAQNPGQETILVSFLGRQGRTNEALDLLSRVWDNSNPAALSQVVSVLLRNNINKEQVQRLDTILQSALKHFDRPIPLLMIEAELCSKQGRYAAAEGCYREVILKAPGNADALSDLALLLALQGSKLDEASRLVKQAIDVAGPVGAMLESRAMVHLALRESDKAIADMADALADAELPVRLFHQARAYDQAGKQNEATAAMEKAMQKGLKEDMIHPLELSAFEKLKPLPR
jgi:cellulose synthase operon protein C